MPRTHSVETAAGDGATATMSSLPPDPRVSSLGGACKKEATATQTGGPACQPDLSGPVFLSQKQVAQPTPCGVLIDPKGNVYQVPSNKRHPKLTLGAQEGSSKPPLIPGEGLAQQGREVLCAHTAMPIHKGALLPLLKRMPIPAPVCS